MNILTHLGLQVKFTSVPHRSQLLGVPFKVILRMEQKMAQQISNIRVETPTVSQSFTGPRQKQQPIHTDTEQECYLPFLELGEVLSGCRVEILSKQSFPGCAIWEKKMVIGPENRTWEKLSSSVCSPLFLTGKVTPSLFGYLALPGGDTERRLEGRWEGRTFLCFQQFLLGLSLYQTVPARHPCLILTSDT